MRPRRAEAPSTPVSVRLSPAERVLVRQAAQVNNQKVAQFLRDALVTAAEECLETPRRSVAILRLEDPVS